jgi:hypothetical protein
MAAGPAFVRVAPHPAGYVRPGLPEGYRQRVPDRGTLARTIRARRAHAPT